MTPPDPLAAAALKLTASDPAYLGYWLDRHKIHEHLTNDTLAEFLGMAAHQLPALSLCRTPRMETFAEDVAELARFTSANADRLTSLLRQEQNLAAWAAPRPFSASAPAAGWLLAAHDADQPPPGEPSLGDEGDGDAPGRS